MRRGFTLIEMLLVIAIIGVLMGILIPAVSGARRTAQGAAGAANMRSLSQIHFIYTADNKNEFYNAFTSFGGGSHSVAAGDGVWRFGWLRKYYPHFNTDGFAPYWYAFMQKTDLNGGLPLDIQFSPADGDSLSRFRTMGSGVEADEYLFPGSYYYSPTFWKEHSLYNAAEFRNGSPYWVSDPPPPPPKCEDPSIKARRFVEEVTYPSQKVLLYERADFQQPRRVRIEQGRGETEAISPGWSNPRAKPQVITVDGAMRVADMYELTEAAARGLKEDPDRAMVPVQIVRPPNLMPVLPSHGKTYIEEGHDGDGLYPYFFAGTRYGLKGRDLLR